MTIRLAATEDMLEPGYVLALRPAARAIYVRRGSVEVEGMGTPRGWGSIGSPPTYDMHGLRAGRAGCLLRIDVNGVNMAS